MANTDNKKILKYIFIVLTLIAIMIVGYLLLSDTQDVGEVKPPITTAGDPFPSYDSSGNPIDPTNQGGATTTTTTPQGDKKRLIQLTTTPTAGAVAFERAGDIIVRYTDRETGQSKEINMNYPHDAITVQEQSLPGVQESLWSDDGSRVVLRVLETSDGVDTVKTVSMDVTGGSSTAPSAFFPDNIREIVAGPFNHLLYILETPDHSFGITATMKNETIDQVFHNPLKQWNLQWTDNNRFFATTRASHGLPGYLFAIDQGSGEFEKVLGPIDTLLTLVNNTGDLVLYSETNDKRHVIYVLDREEGVSKRTTLATLPDKCTWSALSTDTAYCAKPSFLHQNDLPDAWFKSAIYFEDSLVVYNADSEKEGALVNLKGTSGKAFDAIKLFLDPTEEYLYFFNKRDYTLWAYRLITE